MATLTGITRTIKPRVDGKLYSDDWVGTQATINGEDVGLSWNSVSHPDFVSFDLERSTDQQNWTTLQTGVVTTTYTDVAPDPWSWDTIDPITLVVPGTVPNIKTDHLSDVTYYYRVQWTDGTSFFPGGEIAVPFTVPVAAEPVDSGGGNLVSGGVVTYNDQTDVLTVNSDPGGQSVFMRARGFTWDWTTPSLQDETDYYNNIAGWTIPAGASTDWNGRNTWNDGNAPDWNATTVHDDTEGCDLWTWWHHVQRHGGSTIVSGVYTVQDWYNQVLQWYKDNMLDTLDGVIGNATRDDDRFFFDHVYGTGLATVYNATGDSAALQLMEDMRARVQGEDDYTDITTQTSSQVAKWEGRQIGRWALLAAYGAEAIGTSPWISFRDDMVWAYENTSDWEEGGVIQAGGMSFAGRSQAGFVDDNPDLAAGRARYDAGYRFHSTFQIGIMAEAMWRLYIQTGNITLRDRLIKMARYVEYYAHQPTWNYPNSGSRFGHKPDGSWWHSLSESGHGDGTENNAATDCSYDAGLVNLCVIGYKLTGDNALLNRARVHFARCNRWDEAGPTFGGTYEILTPSKVDTEVFRYIDMATTSPPKKYFAWNKGVWQYTYQLFENGGNP